MTSAGPLGWGKAKQEGLRSSFALSPSPAGAQSSPGCLPHMDGDLAIAPGKKREASYMRSDVGQFSTHF